MGYVSTYEDIDERRLEAEFHRGFDDLIKWVRAHSFEDLLREQHNLESVALRMIEYIENRKQDALKAFHEALKIFREPHVRIMNRLAKRENELKELREKTGTTELNLEKCRTRRHELEAKLKTALNENGKLKQRIDQLEDRLAWFEEATGKKPWG
jgi:chromosome segregation ATPase